MRLIDFSVEKIRGVADKPQAKKNTTQKAEMRVPCTRDLKYVHRRTTGVVEIHIRIYKVSPTQREAKRIDIAQHLKRAENNNTWAAAAATTSSPPAAAAARVDLAIIPVKVVERRRERTAAHNRREREPQVRRRLVPDERRQVSLPAPLPASLHDPGRHAAAVAPAPGGRW